MDEATWEYDAELIDEDRVKGSQILISTDLFFFLLDIFVLFSASFLVFSFSFSFVVSILDSI